MRMPLRSVLVAVCVGLLIPVAAAPEAYAGSTQCGSANGLCIDVVGAGLRVDQVRGRADPPTCNKKVFVHFDFFAARWKVQTPEKLYEGQCIDNRGVELPESGWIPVNMDFPDGTEMCTRMTYREGNQVTTPFREECVKIRK